MSTRMLTLAVPEKLYSHYKHQAQADKVEIDDFVLKTLVRHAPPAIEDDLPLKLRMELEAMSALSDEALWAIGRSVMNEDKVALYDLLLERKQMDNLTVEGQELLDSLHEEADFLMVRKAHAYTLLQSRGHKLPSIDELRDQGL